EAEPGLGGRPAVASVIAGVRKHGAAAGHRGDDPVRADSADAMVARVGDVEAAIGADRQSADSIELCQDRGPAVTVVASDLPLDYAPRDGGNDPVRADFTYDEIVVLDDVQAPVRAGGDRARPLDLGRRRLAPIPGRPGRTVAGECGDDP